MLDIRFTPEAELTYQALAAQLQAQWGEKFVAKLEHTTEKALKRISKSPAMYPVVLEKHDLRKCVLHKNCSLFYKVYDEYILVTWFWDNRQQPLFT